MDLSINFKIVPEMDVAKINVLLTALKSSLGSLGNDIKMIDGDAIKKEYEKIDSALKTVGDTTKKTNEETENFKKNSQNMPTTGIANAALGFNMVYDSVAKLAGSFDKVIMAGDAFYKSLHAVGAFTGTSGKQLDELGERARNLGRMFGTTATAQLDSFSGILSKMGPAYAQSGAALEGMAKNVMVLAKASGMDAGTSMEVLTNTMLQFGLRTGDANKDLETSRTVINALAASARAGASQIPDVGQAILVAGAAAKGANMGFQDAAAAIQVLSLGGKTGSEAGNGLRNVIGLLQNVSGEGEKWLTKMGIGTTELAQVLTTQGLGPAIEKLKGGLSQLGSDSERNIAKAKLFGMENASAASIMIDNVGRYKEFQDAINEGTQGTGTAFEMMAQKGGSTSGMVNKWKAQVEDVYISLQQTMGNTLSAVLKASTSVAPMLLSFGSLKNVIPEGVSANISKFSMTMISQLFPSLVVTDGASQKLNLSTSGLANAFNGLGGNIKKFLVSLVGQLIPGLVVTDVATGATSISFQALGASATAAWGAITGPVILVVAAVVAVIAIFAILYAKSESFRTLIDTVVQGMVYIAERSWEVIQRLVSIFMTLGEVIFTFIAAPFKYAWNIVSGLLGSFSSLGNSSQNASAAIKSIGVAFDYVMIGINYVQAGLKGFMSALESVTSSISGVIVKILKGDFVGAITELTIAGDNAGKAFNTGFAGSLSDNTIKDKAKELARGVEEATKITQKVEFTGKFDKLVSEYEAMQSQISKLSSKSPDDLTTEDKKRLDDLKKKAQETAGEIAKIAPNAKENLGTITDSNGKLVESFDINIAKAREFNKAQKENATTDLSDSQKTQSAGIIEMSNAYQEQVKILDDIKKQKVEAEKAGRTDEVAKKNKEYDEQKKKIEENKEALTKAYQDASKQKLLLPEAEVKVGKVLGIEITMDDVKARNAADALATQIKDNLKITAEIKTNTNFDTLVSEYEKTQEKINFLKNKKETGDLTAGEVKQLDNLEKKAQQTANEIAKIAPSAKEGMSFTKDANGNLVESFDINIAKAQEFSAEQKKMYGDDVKTAQANYSNSLGEISGIYDTNKSKLSDIEKAIQQANAAGNTDEVNKKKKEYEQLLVQINKYKDELITAYAEGKKAGLLSGDAQQQLLDKIGMTEDGVNKYIQAQKGGVASQKDMTDAVDETGKAVESLGDKFNKSLDAAKKAQKGAVSELAGAYNALRNAQATGTTEDVAKAEEVLSQAKLKSTESYKKAKTEEKQMTEDEKKAQKELGVEIDKKAKKQGDSNKAHTTALELALKEYETYKKTNKLQIDNYEIQAETRRLLQEREKNSIDELASQQLKIQMLQKEKEKMLEIFKIKTDEQGNIINIGVAINEKDQKLIDDYDKKIENWTNKKEDLVKKYNIQYDVDGNIITENVSEKVIKEIKDIDSKLQKTEDAKIKFTAKMDDKSNKVKEDFIALNNDILKETNKEKSITVKMKTEDIDYQNKLKELERNKLKFEIEIGIRSPSEMVPLLENDLNDLTDKLNEQTQKKVTLETQLSLTTDETAKQDILAQIFEINKTINEISNKEFEAKKTLRAEKKKINDQELKDLQEKQNEELKIIEQNQGTEKKVFEIVYKITEEGSQSNLVKDKNNEISQLEDLKKRQVISEEEFNARKLKIEEEYQKKSATLKDITRGAELEFERQQALKILNIKLKNLQDQESKATDPEEKKKLAKQIGDIQVEVQEKGDLLKAYSGELQTGVTEIFSNLFTGDEEAMKAPFRTMFGVLGGVIKQTASALVTKLILEQLALTPGGLFALLLTPVIAAVVNAGVGVIINPIIQGLTSFSTGGRADEPTLAIVGDASQSRTGSDTEWILRDDQIRYIINEALKYQNSELSIKFNGLAQIITNNFKESITEQNIWNLIQKDITIDKYNELTTQITGLNIEPIVNELKNLNKSITSIQPYMKQPITVDSIINLVDEFKEIQELEKKYYSNLISQSEYLNKLNIHSFNVKSYAGGSGFINEPELAIIGDAGVNNPEIVLNSPQLTSIIREAGNNGNTELANKIDTLISVLQKKEFTAYLNSEKITDEVNRENNRRRWG